MRKLSKTSSQIDGQPMFKLLDKIKKLESNGKDIIHFEIGDPDFDTPKNISDATINALKNGQTHYVSSFGLAELRQKICESIEKSRGFKPELEQVLVTPGANIVIFYAVSCLVDPGEEIIFPDPGFPTYNAAIKMCGASPVRVPLLESNEFRMNPDDIEKIINKKTNMVIINSPQNHTGSVMTKDEIKTTYEIAEKHDLFLYSDEIYSKLIYDNNKYSSPSIFDKCKERTILADGFSKAYAMTGWRLGSVVGPSDIIEKMQLLLETTSSCVSPFIQKAGIEAIDGDQTFHKYMHSEYRKRRDLIVRELNSIEGINCIMPSGAFYVFINIKKTNMTSEQFCDYILEDADVAILPGTSFGRFGEGYVRICYAVKQEQINDAVERIRTSINKLNL